MCALESIVGSGEVHKKSVERGSRAWNFIRLAVGILGLTAAQQAFSSAASVEDVLNALRGAGVTADYTFTDGQEDYSFGDYAGDDWSAEFESYDWGTADWDGFEWEDNGQFDLKGANDN